MANTTSPLLPQTEKLLQAFGERLRLARLRRRLQAKQVAERAGMTEVTLRRVERGLSGVTMGAYLAVMQVLHLQNDIDSLAAEDPLGRHLQDSEAQGGMRPRRARRMSATQSSELALQNQQPSVPAISAVKTENAHTLNKKGESASTVATVTNTNSISSTDLLSVLKLPSKPSVRQK